VKRNPRITGDHLLAVPLAAIWLLIGLITLFEAGKRRAISTIILLTLMVIGMPVIAAIIFGIGPFRR
jgi:hypothetical protein